MAVLEPAVACRPHAPSSVGPKAPRNIVSLHGCPDAPPTALPLTLAKAIAADDADLVVDLSDVPILDQEAVEVILRARDFLGARSRRLIVRSPSLDVWHALESCGASNLTEPRAAAVGPAVRRQ